MTVLSWHLMISWGQMGMTAHAKPKGWGDMLGARGMWILDSMRIAQQNEGRLPIPLPQSRAPRLSGLFMFFDLGARPRDPGVAPGRLHWTRHWCAA